MADTNNTNAPPEPKPIIIDPVTGLPQAGISFGSPEQQLTQLQDIEVISYGEYARNLQAIADVAAGGGTITAQNFNDADASFNAIDNGTFRDVKQEAGIAAVGRLPPDPSIDDIIHETEKVRTEYINTLGDKLKDGGASPLSNNAAIGDAFQREVVDHTPYHKNTDVTPGADEQAFLGDLLSKNRGVAVGEIHTKAGSAAFLDHSMDTLKKSGVDTIYIEAPADTTYMTDSAESLRKRADSIPLETTSDQHDADNLRMMASAKEHGIRIVNIDRKGDARDAEADFKPNYRINATDFTWTDAIEKDRAALAQSGHKDGKFVVLAGAGHFENDQIAEGNKGLVDDALGIPVISFAPAEKYPAIMKSPNASGADFYVPAKGYADLPLDDTASTVNKAADGLSPFGNLPGMSEVITGMKVWAHATDSVVVQSFNDTQIQVPKGLPAQAPAQAPASSVTR